MRAVTILILLTAIWIAAPRATAEEAVEVEKTDKIVSLEGIVKAVYAEEGELKSVTLTVGTEKAVVYQIELDAKGKELAKATGTLVSVTAKEVAKENVLWLTIHKSKPVKVELEL